MSSDHRLVNLKVLHPSSEMDAMNDDETRLIIEDILKRNTFLPLIKSETAQGPYALVLSFKEGRIFFDIHDQTLNETAEIILSASPFRQIFKDYHDICAAYDAALKNLPPIQIETIDMGRRGIHNEAATLLRERLKGKITLDHETARRLFTLIRVLYYRAVGMSV